MDRLENATATAKKFVVKHKTKIAVIATAATCLAINQIAVTQHNDFLKEHGLFDAFYNSDNEDI